jgi:hypothetical protein
LPAGFQTQPTVCRRSGAAGPVSNRDCSVAAALRTRPGLKPNRTYRPLRFQTGPHMRLGRARKPTAASAPAAGRFFWRGRKDSKPNQVGRIFNFVRLSGGCDRFRAPHPLMSAEMLPFFLVAPSRQLRPKEFHPVAPEYRPRWLLKRAPLTSPRPVRFKPVRPPPVKRRSSPVWNRSQPSRSGGAPSTAQFQTRPRPHTAAFETPGPGLVSSRTAPDPPGPASPVGFEISQLPEASATVPGTEQPDTGGQEFGRVHKNAKTRYCDLAFHSSERFE